MSCKPYLAVIGVGNVPVGTYPDRSINETVITAAVNAIKDAGIDKDEIDLVLTTGSIFDPGQVTIEYSTAKVVEELGLKRCRRNFEIFSGGSSSTNGMKVANGLFATGEAKVALMVQGDKLATGFDADEELDVDDAFTYGAYSPQWEIPFGYNFTTSDGITLNGVMFSQNGIATRDDFLNIAISNSKWAKNNPCADRREELTAEGIKAKKPLASGLYEEEVGKWLDGGNAFVMTTAEYAEELYAQGKCGKPVYVTGSGAMVDHCSVAGETITTENFREASVEAFEEANMRPEDIDILNLYDFSTPGAAVMFDQVMQLDPGGWIDYFKSGRTAPGGKQPYCTNGGIMHEGHTGAGGSFGLLVETIRQLQGKAGERQVKDAKTAVLCTSGGAGGDANVTILSNVKPE